MRDLESAIKHAEEVAEENEGMCRVEDAMGLGLQNDEMMKCASEHRQLAEWLRALKEIWDSGDCNTCANKNCKIKPKLGQMVRFNCFFYEEDKNEHRRNH